MDKYAYFIYSFKLGGILKKFLCKENNNEQITFYFRDISLYEWLMTKYFASIWKDMMLFGLFILKFVQILCWAEQEKIKIKTLK